MEVFSALGTVQNTGNRKDGDSSALKYLKKLLLPSEIKGYFFNINSVKEVLKSYSRYIV